MELQERLQSNEEAEAMHAEDAQQLHKAQDELQSNCQEATQNVGRTGRDTAGDEASAFAMSMACQTGVGARENEANE
eukprot:scaffold53694_cov18-Tisochrysis_lutea.AAC.2